MSDNGQVGLHSEDAIIVAKALFRIADWLGLPRQELSTIISAADDKSYASALQASAVASENALLLIRLHSLLAGAVGGNARAAASWLESYNASLKARPLELMQQGTGLKQIIDYLESHSL